MKHIFEVIIVILGLCCVCIFPAQVPAVSWTTYNPFQYCVPYFGHQAGNVVVGNPFASSDTASRPVLEKQEMQQLQRQLTEIRMAVAQLATKSDLEVTNMDVKKILSNLQMLTTNFATKSELDAIQTDLDQKATKSELDVFQIKLDEKATKSELDETKTEVTRINSNLQNLTQEFANSGSTSSSVVEIGHMPESCADLQSIGYEMNGFFQVKGKEKIEHVYCNFTRNAKDLQKLVGFADVKSMAVYFYVQKNASFFTKLTPITFDLERVNEGKAMNLTTGIFMAPRTGIYFFSFTGLPEFSSSSSLVYLAVGLYLNNNRIGFAWVDEANTQNTQNSPLNIQSTLKLKSGDQVWVQIESSSTGVFLYDDLGHFTHFTGFILEEDIVASL